MEVLWRNDTPRAAALKGSAATMNEQGASEWLIQRMKA